MDIWCKACGHRESLKRTLRPDEGCPICDAGLYRRRGPPPRPGTHIGHLVKSLFTLRGIMLIVVVAGLASFPDWRVRGVAAIMLTLGALKLAMRAMRVSNRDGVEFPELSVEELFDARALVPSLVFSVVFLIGPMLLAIYAFTAHRAPTDDAADDDHDGAFVDDATYSELDWSRFREPPKDRALAEAQLAAQREAAQRESVFDDDAPAPPAPPQPVKPRHAKAPAVSGLQVAAGLGALFLVVFAPMALVMYLRTGTTFALFFVPQGVSAIAGDVRGYASLCAFVWPAFIGVLALDHAASMLPFFADPLVQLPRGALVLLAWGLCGLYVRSRAREFDLPVDDDDWVLHPRRLAPSPAPPPQRGPRAPIALDDGPVVPGTLL